MILQSNTRKEFALYAVLSGFFIANALIAELTGVKIFSAGALLGITSGWFASLNLSVGVIIWPLVFVVSDIVNEYYGKTGVKRLSFLTAMLVTYAFIIIYAGTGLPPAEFWLKNNATDSAGNLFNINYAYEVIFRQGGGIIIGSVTAFLVGQLLDVYVFHYIKRFTGHRFLWLRATGSTVISQIVDSMVVLFVAFYLLGNWKFSEIIAVGSVQYVYKVSMAILLTPLLYVIHYFIERYLGYEKSEQLAQKADAEW